VTIEQPSSLTRIEKSAFSGTGLLEIEIPASVQSLGRECFSLSRSLVSVTFEKGSQLKLFDYFTFSESGSIEIVIPASVMGLESDRFISCKRFRSVRLEPVFLNCV
jgi:hypothetical protein